MLKGEAHIKQSEQVRIYQYGLTVILGEAEIGRIVHQGIDLIVADIHSQRCQCSHLIQVIKVEVVHRIVGQIDVLQLRQVLKEN